jgi:hypothetical protein
MKTWQYHRGDWSEIEDPLAIVWTDSPEQALADLGYRDWFRFGNTDEIGGPSVRIYRTTKETVVARRWEYLAFFAPQGDEWEDYVFLSDLPSALGFVKEFAPIIQAQARRDIEHLIAQAVKKSFRLWHGHDAEVDDCLECDPDEVHAREERWQQRRATKATAA